MAEGPAFYIYEDAAGEWRWRLLAANGETVADSGEGYTSESGCKRAVQMITRLVRDDRLHLH